MDTLVDFTSVDFSPSFEICNSLIDKQKKSECFRNTMHQKVGAALQKHIFTIKDSIDETVLVDVVINSEGEVLFKALQTTENLQTQLPELENIIKESVRDLPKIYPAIKRGIPVTTKYQLPIKIKLKE